MSELIGPTESMAKGAPINPTIYIERGNEDQPPIQNYEPVLPQ